METLQVIIAVALAVAVGLFWLTHRRTSGTSSDRARRERRAGRASKRPQRGPRTAGDLLNVLAGLRASNAQWAQILAAVNPTQQPDVAELLFAIRGPHMFDPRTALGVIETGARNVPHTAPIAMALAEARESMNKVVGFGR